MHILPTLTQIFNAFSGQEISYCHWKSNEHLDAALLGKTDLDILVDPGQIAYVRDILRAHGCKRLHSRRDTLHPEREDWIGMDEETGAQFHFDLHTGIVIGPRAIKIYDVPIVQWLLRDTVLVEHVQTAAPNKELVMLVMRALLKESLSADIRHELDWLLSQTDVVGAVEACGDMNCGVPVNIVSQFLERYTQGQSVYHDLRKELHRALGRYRCRSIYAEYSIRLMQVIRAKLHIRRVRYHKIPGTLLAIVGADGSGKTTASKKILDWLGWKVSVRHIYFGLPREAMMVRVCVKLRTTIGGSFFDSCYWLAVAWVRYRKYRFARSLVSQGYIVIAERYPLKEFWNMTQPMDGPRIPLSRRIASRIERWLYTNIHRPNHLIVLHTPLGVLKERKSEKRIEEKASAVDALDGDGVSIFSTDRPAEETMQEVKRCVWNKI